MQLPKIDPLKLIGHDATGYIKAVRILRSGNAVDVLNPKPEQFDIQSIASGLAYQGRFTGQTSQYYSVAMHSLLVSRLVPEELALEGLLHDAAEAVLNDISRPVKLVLPGYKPLETAVAKAIAVKYNLKYPWPEEIKLADEVAVAIEQNYLLPDTPYWPHIFTRQECEDILDSVGLTWGGYCGWGGPEPDLGRFLGRFMDLMVDRV